MGFSTTISYDLWDRKHNMAIDPSRYICLILCAGLLGIGQVNAQPSGVEAVANYAGPDRQRMLEDGARREGSLLLYTTGTQIKPLLDRFEEKYPFVRVELA